MRSTATTFLSRLPASFALLLATVSQAPSPCLAGEPPATITFASLLDEMANREALARWPNPEFTVKQASSYDRISRTPGNYDWFSNRDWSNFIRAESVKSAGGERVEHVMLDEAGPGAIVRWWVGGFTNAGTIRVYIDGATEPVLSGTADDMIGGPKYFPEPFAATRAKGTNLYVPIPYAKRIKITYDGPLPERTESPGEQGFWYNINYRTYAAGTHVQSFSPLALASHTQKLRGVALALTTYTDLDYQVHGTLRTQESFRRQIAAGPRGAAISAIRVHVRAADMQAALRETLLRIVFDGKQTVEVPLGDFFGSGVGLNPAQDRYRRADADGNLAADWVMPFRERGEVELVNTGQQTVEYAYADASIPWTWDERSMYFHAAWRRETFDTQTRGDFNYLTVEERRGLYVGDTLSVFNPPLSPRQYCCWWGEGDEKIWVDGESFPSHFGTGTEDYYGYAWGTTALFNSPFHGQPRADAMQQGYTVNNRVRILDTIPFRSALKLDMEIWHVKPVQMTYAVATFWYASPQTPSPSSRGGI